MSPHFTTDGYEIVPSRLSSETLHNLRLEADHLATAEKSACVRHIRAKSNLFAQLAISPELLDLLPPNFTPVRSILFDKNSAQNWPVAWHQDLTITTTTQKEVSGYGPWSQKDGSPHVQPPTELLSQMITIRLHLDDTPSENGALSVIPKSHLLGKIPSSELSTEQLKNPVTCACAEGDILLMSPLILHRSSRAQKPARRRVLHFEYAPQKALHPDLQWFEATT